MSADVPSDERRTRLGPFDIACVVIGGIIGIGIFFTPAQIARDVDAAWHVTVAWCLGGAIAILGAMVFARLSRLAPGPGGVFEYLFRGFGPGPAFVYGWCNLLIIQAGALSFVALLLVSFLGKALDFTFSGWWPHALASAAILILTVVNIAGLRLGKGVQNTLTVIKVGAVFAIVATALFVTPETPPVAVRESGGPAKGFFLAMSAAILPVLFSFGGWQHGSYVSTVARRPRIDVPIGIIGGVVVVVIAYVSVNEAYLALLGFGGAAGAEAVAFEAMASAFSGPGEPSVIPRVFAGLIVLSCAGLLNTICMAPPYVLHTMAARGLFFRSMGRLHPKFDTPAVGMAAQGVWACVLLWVVGLVSSAEGDAAHRTTHSLDFLLNGVVFVDWLGFGACAVALLVLLRRGAGMSLAGILLGVAFGLAAVFVTVGALTTKTQPSLVGLGVLVAGIPAFLWFRRAR